MSGIVGSRLNNRGSGLVGSLGTDGQVFTSAGAGAGAVFEAAAGGGGKILQIQHYVNETATSIGNTTTMTSTAVTDQITPSADSSKILVMMNIIIGNYDSDGVGNRVQAELRRSIDGGAFSAVYQDDGNVYAGVVGFGMSGEGSSSFPSTLVFVDSPSTTDAIDYTWYMCQAWNNDAGDSANTGPSSLDSSVTLMEIDGS